VLITEEHPDNTVISKTKNKANSRRRRGSASIATIDVLIFIGSLLLSIGASGVSERRSDGGTY
jgi:hypothetical protein